jgi:hypothetical protein
VPGTLPGYLGEAAFAGVKFVGYSLAVSGRKKLEPVIASTRTKIAAVRTGLGVLRGPLATRLLVFLISLVFVRRDTSPNSPNWSLQMPEIYSLFFIVRIFVWAFVLFLFTNKSPIPKSKFWLYAFVGAIVSSLLDLPGYALALAAPGKIVVC